MATMTLEELLAKLPPSMQDIGRQYGAQVLAMGVDGARQWLNYVLLGDYLPAYKMLLKADTDAAFLAEWDAKLAVMQAQNAANADQMALSKEIAYKVCAGVLTLVLALVGL